MDFLIEKITSFPVFEKILSISVGVIILFALSTGISFVAFSYYEKTGATIFKSPEAEKQTASSESIESARDVACPLNGAFYTKEKALLWNSRRPIGVMVENHTEARPQWGLSLADVVYEAVAEGGITRFLTLFYCQDATNIGPVRSARTYYIDWLFEYGLNPIYVHIGGAGTPGPADALGQIIQIGWDLYNDINEMRGDGGFPAIWRGPEKPAPHNAHTATQKVWDLAKKRGLTAVDQNGQKWDINFKKWSFKDETPMSARPASFSAQVNFWPSEIEYAVDWTYDNTTNSYQRFNSEGAHQDALNNKQLAPKVVVIQFMDELRANDGYQDNVHLLYKNTGSGPALIFQDGLVTSATWQKKDRSDRTIYLDKNGTEIKFNRGQIWIQTIPTGIQVKY